MILRSAWFRPHLLYLLGFCPVFRPSFRFSRRTYSLLLRILLFNFAYWSFFHGHLLSPSSLTWRMNILFQRDFCFCSLFSESNVTCEYFFSMSHAVATAPNLVMLVVWNHYKVGRLQRNSASILHCHNIHNVVTWKQRSINRGGQTCGEAYSRILSCRNITQP